MIIVFFIFGFCILIVIFFFCFFLERGFLIGNFFFFLFLRIDFLVNRVFFFIMLFFCVFGFLVFNIGRIIGFGFEVIIVLFIFFLLINKLFSVNS